MLDLGWLGDVFSVYLWSLVRSVIGLSVPSLVV